MNRIHIHNLPDECRALLDLAQIAVYEAPRRPGVVLLYLSNKYGECSSQPIPQSHLAMFGVLEQHLKDVLAEPIMITMPDR